VLAESNPWHNGAITLESLIEPVYMAITYIGLVGNLGDPEGSYSRHIGDGNAGLCFCMWNCSADV
jgi:hypothetical protein